MKGVKKPGYSKPDNTAKKAIKAEKPMMGKLKKK